MSLAEQKRHFPHIAYLDIEEHFEKTEGNWVVPFREEDRENFQNVVDLCQNAESVHQATKTMVETQGRRSRFLNPEKYSDFELATESFGGKNTQTEMEQVSAAKRAFEVLAGKRTYAELERGDIEAGRQLARHLISNFRMRFPNQP